MTRYVIAGRFGVFSVRAATVSLTRPEGISRTTAVHLRWMLRPQIGMPRQPFVVWRRAHPGGNPTKQELANISGWEQIEVVGLPVDQSWSDTQYRLVRQGLQAQQAPVDAALDRLRRGAPQVGWPTSTGVGSVPAWVSSDVSRYLADVLVGRLLAGVHQMMHADPWPMGDYDFALTEQRTGPALTGLLPQLLINKAVAGLPSTAAASSNKASATWLPGRALAVAAASDPYSALALGFGTAIVPAPASSGPAAATIYMVSVTHRYSSDSPEIELADVVTPAAPPPPDAPSALNAARKSYTPPQMLDGAAMDDIRVGWARPPDLADSVELPGNYPASYAVAAFEASGGTGTVLLTPRPPAVGGWLPFVGGVANDASDIGFLDHRTLTARVAGQVVPTPLPVPVTYAVATQDLFGRWSPWRTASYQGAAENAQAPTILSVKLTPQGDLTVDFSWDWTDRSPEFIKLSGAFVDDGVTVWSLNAHFAGAATPAPLPAGMKALDRAMKEVGFGAPQDNGAPGTRYYRATAHIALNFAGKPSRDFKVKTQGQCHVHQAAIAGFGIASGAPATVKVYDATPPEPPVIDPSEAPIWASLRDGAGMSRAALQWRASGGAAGYVVYEATETSVLSARGQSGPDTSRPFTTRLAVLRDQTQLIPRSIFRRVTGDLLEQASCEVTLPRGSNVIHLYAVTAMSANNVESTWAADNKHFFAVAAPRLAVPTAPAIQAVTNAAATPSVTVSFIAGDGVPSAEFELFRMAGDVAPESADAMGPRLIKLTPNAGKATFSDTTVKADWRRNWYRAVAWSAGETLKGIREARSMSSAPVSVVLPPPGAPSVTDPQVNLPGSTQAETLVSFATSAPWAITPLGSHVAIIAVIDPAGKQVASLQSPIDTTPTTASASALPPFTASAPIVRVGTTASYRLYARVTRPSATQAFNIVAKVIDPLGRIGSTSIAVPPLPAAPALSAVAFQRTGTSAVRPTFVTFQVTSAIPAASLHQYRLRVSVQVGTAPPIVQQGMLDAIGSTPSIASAPTGLLRRIGTTQIYVLGLGNRSIITPIIATVTLRDAIGRVGTATGRVN